MSRRPGARTKRALAHAQARLERYYGLEAAPSVLEFTRVTAQGEREVLLVRDLGTSVELALRVPAAGAGKAANDATLQLIEGVSHFVYLAERVRTGLPTTQLELELQAEVDKFVLLALEPEVELRHEEARGLHRVLFEQGRFLHRAGTELGERYRLANELAARLSARLIGREPRKARHLLRRFYRAGQTEKIALARAA